MLTRDRFDSIRLSKNTSMEYTNFHGIYTLAASGTLRWDAQKNSAKTRRFGQTFVQTGQPTIVVRSVAEL